MTSKAAGPVVARPVFTGRVEASVTATDCDTGPFLHFILDFHSFGKNKNIDMLVK